MKSVAVKCSDCRHYKDRYTLFMHGPFPTLRKLLELNLIDERDFICEGWGCIYHPLEDFAHDEHMQPIFPDDLPPHTCEYFEPKKNLQELAKNIMFESEHIARGKKAKHLDISSIHGRERQHYRKQRLHMREAMKEKKEKA